MTLPGDVFRLALTVDASGVDVGASAVWLSSAPQVAEVTAGTVRALAAGETQITATFSGVRVAVTVQVTALTSLDGFVHQPAPLQQTGVAEALVAVVGGRFDGRQVRTDAFGRFHLSDVAGTVRLQVTSAGFDTFYTDVDTTAHAVLDVTLPPLSDIVTEVYAFSTGYQPGDPPLRSRDEFAFATHSAGTIQVTLDSWRTPYDGDYFSVDLLSGTDRLVHLQNCDTLAALIASGCTASRLPDAFTFTTTGSRTFVLTLSSERRLILAYHVTLTRPR